MDKIIRTHLDNIRTGDGEAQFKAYDYLMKETEQPVDWAYEAWDEIVAGLTHKDNHVRAITSQIFSHLAISDPKGRMFKDFDCLLYTSLKFQEGSKQDDDVTLVAIHANSLTK